MRKADICVHLLPDALGTSDPARREVLRHGAARLFQKQQ